MQIHRIHGRDLREALERAGRLHGKDAVVLGHEQVAGGVTVAVTAKAAAEAREQAGRGAATGTAARPAPTAAPVADGGAELASPATPGRVHGRTARSLPPGLADVERALSRTGTSPRLIGQVLTEIERSSARGAYAIDQAARLLGERIALAPSPKVDRAGRGPCVIAFVGPRGSGVSTTVTKLAGKLVKARRRIALVDLVSTVSTSDGSGVPGASSELEKYGRVLQVPVDRVDTADELQRVIERSRGSDAVLIDGTGIAGRDVAVLRELLARVPQVRLEVYLTLPATAYRGELDAIAADYAPAEPAGLVLTQLDSTRTPAVALEHALDTRRPLAFFCDGPDVSGNLRRPTADSIANLFLRGRLR